MGTDKIGNNLAVVIILNNRFEVGRIPLIEFTEFLEHLLCGRGVLGVKCTSDVI